MSSIDEKIIELCVAQSETHTLLQTLTSKVDKYVDADEKRHEDIVNFRIESSKSLTEVATILKDLKNNIDKTRDGDIPTLQKKVASAESTIKNHGWLIRAIVGVTFIAILSGMMSTVTTCNSNNASAAQITYSYGDSDVADTDMDGE